MKTPRVNINMDDEKANMIAKTIGGLFIIFSAAAGLVGLILYSL